MSQDTLARKLEADLARSVAARLPGTNIYRMGENSTRNMPCAIFAARATGTAYEIKYQGDYATSIELRVICMVSVTGETSSEDLELLARNVLEKVETATDLTGWNYLRLDHQGDERNLTEQSRMCTLLFGATAI
jgi:hypothetical protein